ncbi:ATP-binding protein [Streptomyces himalayensis]|uniref:ATP-binding protein n=1 Tax=Streptomyces himalayensis subsp. himalayensis TaxID=2756131 RepID=A0A7W0I7G8_9ACTN|nr:ATP-binding protein [Streptomyces himalayensis]MBA2945290.1 ATP-binding protein [Streptomyces himalayensis subsp. himalayensis]
MPESDDEHEPWEYTLYVPHDPRAVTICRRTLRLVLALHQLPQLAEAAELVASELVSNAVRHTKGPAAIRLRWARGVLRVGVWDADPRPPEPAPTPPAVTDADAEGGRGLSLVRARSADWGWYPLTGTGKYVWCELVGA